MDTNLTPETARQLLEQDKTQRARAAAEDVQRVLAEHGCDLIAVPQIVDGRIVAVVQIVAK